MPSIIKTSVCIIGAGASGITTARNLSEIDDLVMIESGSFEMDGKTQELYAGENKGTPYFDLLTCRLRYFGGTTNHWGGFCRANDPIDYEGRDDLGLPKWPVDQREIDRYVHKAANYLGVDSEFNAVEFLNNNKAPKDDLIENKAPDLSTKVFDITSRKRFGKIHKEELSKQKNLRVYLNLNVVHIQLNANATKVISVHCETFNGKKIVVQSKEFVLSCHAIENARLLLISNDIQQKGVGNDYDHVGRYFMEHVHLSASKFIPSNKFPRIYDTNVMGKFNLNANLGFKDEYLRRTGILQYYCRFKPVYTDDSVIGALRNIKNEINEPITASLINDIKTVLNDASGAANFSLARFGIDQPIPKYYELDHRIEQAPNRDSRVLLSSSRDFFGVPKADLQWKLNEFDYRTFDVGQEKIITELNAQGFGRFITEKMTAELINNRAKGHYHHIGTTKMSLNQRDGVVDSDCKVHGLDNLYIGGSSVFPTAGYSGPTMMIVAFSMRLADKLAVKHRS